MLHPPVLAGKMIELEIAVERLAAYYFDVVG
jgi:hypothetical protein